jgi:shikimate kinase
MINKKMGRPPSRKIVKKYSKKQVIVIRGPLGVGKTNVSALLALELNAVVISLDALLKENDLDGDDGISLENFLKANQILASQINNTDDTVIVDGCFYYQEQIDDLIERVKRPVEFFTLVSDVETCIVRDAQRTLVYGEDAARYVHAITTPISAGVEIDSTHLTPQQTTERILVSLQQYLFICLWNYQ